MQSFIYVENAIKACIHSTPAKPFSYLQRQVRLLSSQAATQDNPRDFHACLISKDGGEDGFRPPRVVVP